MDGLGSLIPFILLFFIFFLLPALARQRHGAEVERQFARVQKKRKSRVLAIVHRQEAMALLGVPQLRYIDLNDAEDVLEAVRNTPSDRALDIVLHTPGGLVLPAMQIARAIKAHPGPTTVYVPHYAMSGGTLIALAADEIVLNPHAVLGPIDPQIGGLPAASIARVVEAKSADATDDYTLVLNDIGRMATEQLSRAAQELLRGTVSANAAAAVADQLSSGRWTHDYPIVAAEAQELGLKVSTDMPKDISDLMVLFPASLRGRNVKFTHQLAALFGRKPQPNGIAKTSSLPSSSEQVPFTGYQPGPGARSFSYGPWYAGDLRPRHDPGPSPRDQRRDR